jgi:hypothetical protein
MWCAACSEGAKLAERGRAAAPNARSVESSVSALPELTALARSARPKEPVRILEPLDGAEIDGARANGLVVRVHAPVTENPKASVELSLDGARPRPITGTTANLADLLDVGASLGPGAHDLVLVLVGADGMALDPRAGGVASSRFFVGARPPTAPVPPRLVCLAPFGTIYGNAPRILLDFVVVSGEGADAVVTIESPGVSRRARATGPGPFLLGDFAGGDHRVTLAPVPGSRPALSGGCAFSRNPELERPP